MKCLIKNMKLSYINAIYVGVAELFHVKNDFTEGNGEILLVDCLVSRKHISDCFILPSSCLNNSVAGVRCLNNSGEEKNN